MVSDGPTARRFLAGLPAEAQASFAGVPDLEERLLSALGAGRHAWPDLTLPDEIFLDFLGRRVARRERPLEALASLHLADLYLVCAFIHGVPGAGEAMQRGYLALLPPLLERLGVRAVIDDVVQSLCVQLISARDPGQAGYEGRGSLRSWLRVAATREARRRVRKGRRDVPLFEDGPAGFLIAGADAELEHIQRSFQPEFKAAFQDALATLTPRERNLLRYYFIDGLNIDEIGAIHRVNRATAAHWISALRSRLLVEVRSALVRRLRVPQPDLDSIIRLLDSQMHLSLQRLLG
jgi:RNA polymerase sigma-70 factor (ECF subfamily)